MEDKPLKTNRRKSMAPPPSDPKLLQILEEFRDYDFTRQITDEERQAIMQRLQENSLALEASRAQINAEEAAQSQEDVEPDDPEEIEDEVMK